MTYRNDHEAAIARAKALEREVEGSNRKLESARSELEVARREKEQLERALESATEKRVQRQVPAASARNTDSQRGGAPAAAIPNFEANPILLGFVMLTLIPLGIGVALWWTVYVVHFAIGLIGGTILLAAAVKALRARRASDAGLLLWMSLALVIGLPFIAFDLVALNWLHTPPTVDRATLETGSVDALEGLIRLGPDVQPAAGEQISSAGEQWEVSAIARRRALVVQSGLRPLSFLPEASADERVARVTVWEPGWLTPKSKPRVIMVARRAQETSGAEMVIEWLPDVQQQARSAWIWLISVLLGANLLWAGYVARYRPGAIALRQLAQASGIKSEAARAR